MKKDSLRIIIMLSKFALYGFLLHMLTFSFLLAYEGTSQDLQSVRKVNIDLSLEDASLAEAFHAIEVQTDFQFAYDKEILEEGITVDLMGKGKTVADYLLEISERASLKFKQVNHQITVSKVKRSERREEKLEVVIDDITISGKVTDDSDGSGLPGVNVIVKGTSQGTVTDVDGVYSLQAPEDGTLIFSSVGYISAGSCNRQPIIDQHQHASRCDGPGGNCGCRIWHR